MALAGYWVVLRHHSDTVLVTIPLVDQYKLRPSDAYSISPPILSLCPPHHHIHPRQPNLINFALRHQGMISVLLAIHRLPLRVSDYGSRARKGKEDDTDSVEECEHEEYDNVYEDLSNRVFVDFDVFLLSVLHVPRDWKTLWGPAIEAVKADQEFSTCHRKY